VYRTAWVEKLTQDDFRLQCLVFGYICNTVHRAQEDKYISRCLGHYPKYSEPLLFVNARYLRGPMSSFKPDADYLPTLRIESPPICSRPLYDRTPPRSHIYECTGNLSHTDCIFSGYGLRARFESRINPLPVATGVAVIQLSHVDDEPGHHGAQG